jgi:hypothetical protein
MGLTSKQWFQIISGSISSFITAGAMFTSLFGEANTLKIIACLGLANIVLSSVGAVLSGPDSAATQIKSVTALPGVDRVLVNAAATDGVAAAAIDPLQPKVGAVTPAVREVLMAKAAV